MKGKALIGAEQRAALQGLLEYAHLHRYGERDMRLQADGKQPAIGMRREHRRGIPPCYLVIYSEEDMGQGFVKHLSVSRRRPNAPEGPPDVAGPDPSTVAQIAGELGFTVDREEHVFTDRQIMLPSPTAGFSVIQVVEHFRPGGKLGEFGRRFFHQHLDSCDQCARNPFGLCNVGAVLLPAGARP